MRISRFYDRIGDKGWSNFSTFSVRSPALRRWIAGQLGDTGMRVLSVGCGTGELENHLSKLQHRVVGIDISQKMLKRARARGLKLLVRGEPHMLPFGKGSFDVVMFIESIGHFHMPTVFKEAARVLDTHGRLLITTYSAGVGVHALYTKFRLDEIISSLTNASFRLVTFRFLNPKRSSVTELLSDAESTLLFVMCARHPTSRLPRASGCIRHTHLNAPSGDPRH
jgi:ubiquinone/menaquinone biosynthesis C-methylase UbiE